LLPLEVPGVSSWALEVAEDDPEAVSPCLGELPPHVSVVREKPVAVHHGDYGGTGQTGYVNTMVDTAIALDDRPMDRWNHRSRRTVALGRRRTRQS
jgi:hypothetical protein